MPRDDSKPPAGGTASASARVAAGAQHDAQRVAARTCISTRSTSTGGLVLAAVPAQSADRRRCRRRRVSASTRCRPIPGCRTRRGGRRRRRVRAPHADAGRRRRSRRRRIWRCASRRGPRCCCRSSAGASGSGCSRSVSIIAPSVADDRRRTPSRVADAFITALELFQSPPGRRAAARRPRAARRVHRQSLGDAEPLGRARYLLPRRQPAVRRRSHVGVDSRAARAPSRAAGVLGSRRRRARRAGRRRRPDGARGGRRCGATAPKSSRRPSDEPSRRWSPCRCAAAGAPSARSSSKACGSRPAASSTLLDRADELGRQLSSADREHAAARGRDAVAPGAREHVRFDLASGRRVRHAAARSST